jgi:hypothetical protein
MIIIITIFITIILSIKKYESFKLSLKHSKKCNNKKQYKISENTKFKYRLSDMFHSYERNVEKVGYKYHKKNYPNSIAVEYMDKTQKGSQYDILLDIVNNRLQQNIKKYNKYKKYIIIHIRTGDIIEKSKCNINNLLYNTSVCNYSKYIKPLSYYKNKINLLKSSCKKFKILIISGFHLGNSINNIKSIQYLKQIANKLKDDNIKIKLRINKDADEDFLIMCNSKYYIPSGGGFSSLISNMVQRKNGTILI